MRTAFRAPCACNRCSLLQHRAGGLRALQTLPQFCAPRKYHGRPHETTQPARSMRLAVRGLRLVNSVVLACLARLPYRTGGHGPRESGQSRRSEGPASTVRAQSIRPRLRPRCGPPVRVREPLRERLRDVRDLRPIRVTMPRKTTER